MYSKPKTMCKIKFILFNLLLVAILNVSCQQSKKSVSEEAKLNISPFEVSDSAFFDLIGKKAMLETVADSFIWSEGPVWVDQLNSVLFSDVPANKIYKWNETEGLSVFLEPSGYTGAIERGGEMGSNVQ